MQFTYSARHVHRIFNLPCGESPKLFIFTSPWKRPKILLPFGLIAGQEVNNRLAGIEAENGPLFPHQLIDIILLPLPDTPDDEIVTLPNIGAQRLGGSPVALQVEFDLLNEMRVFLAVSFLLVLGHIALRVTGSMASQR